MSVSCRMNISIVVSYVHAFISIQRQCSEAMVMILICIKRRCFDLTTLTMIRYHMHIEFVFRRIAYLDISHNCYELGENLYGWFVYLLVCILGEIWWTYEYVGMYGECLYSYTCGVLVLLSFLINWN